jgi:hypothetical protein
LFEFVSAHCNHTCSPFFGCQFPLLKLRNPKISPFFLFFWSVLMVFWWLDPHRSPMFGLKHPQLLAAPGAWFLAARPGPSKLAAATILGGVDLGYMEYLGKKW